MNLNDFEHAENAIESLLKIKGMDSNTKESGDTESIINLLTGFCWDEEDAGYLKHRMECI